MIARTAHNSDDLINRYLKCPSQRNRDLVIAAYYPVVDHVAAKLGRGRAECRVIDQDDLVQAGILGLVSAIESYNPLYGGFRSHAFRQVRYAVLNELRRCGVPPSVYAQGRTQRALEEEDVRPVTESIWGDQMAFAELLDRCRGSLTDQQVFVLVCIYYEGLPVGKTPAIPRRRVTELHQSALDKVAAIIA